MEYLINKLKEKSTIQIILTSIAGIFGVSFVPEFATEIATAVAAIVGAIGIALKDDNYISKK